MQMKCILGEVVTAAILATSASAELEAEIESCQTAHEGHPPPVAR